MFTARTVVVIVALGAAGVAASSARGVDHAFSAPSGTTATSIARPAIADERTPTSGADLTFAPCPPHIGKANVKSKAPLESKISSGPSIPTFAKVPAAMACECWNWTTGKPAPAATASMPLARRVTAQKVTEDLQ